jgi:hypothetical protein
MKRAMLTLLAATCVLDGKTVAENLTCLTAEERSGALLYSHLQQEAYAVLRRRDEAYEQLKTPEQIRAHQRKLRAFCLAIGHPLSDKTFQPDNLTAPSTVSSPSMTCLTW